MLANQRHTPNVGIAACINRKIKSIGKKTEPKKLMRPRSGRISFFGFLKRNGGAIFYLVLQGKYSALRWLKTQRSPNRL